MADSNQWTDKEGREWFVQPGPGPEWPDRLYCNGQEVISVDYVEPDWTQPPILTQIVTIT